MHLAGLSAPAGPGCAGPSVRDAEGAWRFAGLPAFPHFGIGLFDGAGGLLRVEQRCVDIRDFARYFSDTARLVPGSL